MASDAAREAWADRELRRGLHGGAEGIALEQARDATKKALDEGIKDLQIACYEWQCQPTTEHLDVLITIVKGIAAESEEKT